MDEPDLRAIVGELVGRVELLEKVMALTLHASGVSASGFAETAETLLLTVRESPTEASLATAVNNGLETILQTLQSLEAGTEGGGPAA